MPSPRGRGVNFFFLRCAIATLVTVHIFEGLFQYHHLGDETTEVIERAEYLPQPHFFVDRTKNGASNNAVVRRTASPPSSTKTLALLDPRFTGGFRNQHMRLTGLIVYALSQNMSNLLLDSLRYDNKAVSRRDHNSTISGRIPFEDLFDVEHWNQVSDRVGTDILPRLVRYHPELHPDWDPDTAQFRTLGDVLPTPGRMGGGGKQDSGVIFRQTDAYPRVQNCTRPYAFGSGRKVGQRTWGAYMQHKKKQGNQLSRTDVALIEALQPSTILAKAVASITQSHNVRMNGSQPHPPFDSGRAGNMLLAIHPRTELDMLKHKCSKTMTRNLTKIFEMVQSSSFFSEDPSAGTSKYQQVYLCISRSGMEDKTSVYERFKGLMDQNLHTLNQAAEVGLWRGTVRVSEGGEPLAASLGIPWDSVQTAAQVMDFFVAVEARAFLGTFGSSYSTDVWTARYVLAQKHDRHADRDPFNYFHGPDGIGLIGNGGLPPPHKC